MPIVTLSREYAAGGLRVGRRVAEKLGLDLIDAILVTEVARRLQVPEEAVRRWDERREGIVLRLLRSIRAAHPEYAAGSLVPEAAEAVGDAEIVLRVTQEVIEEQARTGSAVFVGRGAAFVLPAGPGTHHFRLVAPFDWRVARLAAEGVEAAAAQRTIEQRDRERVDYVRHHYGLDPREPRHYTLVLNMARIGVEEAAEIIASIARGGAAAS